MTIWLVVAPGDKAALQAAFATHGKNVPERAGKSQRVDEALGVLAMNASGTLGFTGSTRLSPAKAQAVRAMVPNVELYTEWPPPGGWEYPLES